MGQDSDSSHQADEARQRARFGLLGPVEVWDERGAVAVGGVRARCLLAALLLNAERVVSIDQLIDAAWAEHPPASARVQVQNAVSRLRRALREAQPENDLIRTKGSGYLIHLEVGQLDLERFDQHLARADELAATGRRGGAAAELAAALGLWRGPALDGLPTPLLIAAAQRLEEQRLRTYERRIELDIELGRGREVVPELSVLTETHPYREGLHALLMRALYGSGRQAEALQAYRSVRTALVDQLGVEPGAGLQHLHQAILRGDEAPDQLPRADAETIHRRHTDVATPSVPQELPRDVSGFTGRDDQLSVLDEMLRDCSGAVVITAIAGMAGVGKTALAVHWSHRVADEFPDGQLYVNLRGYATGAPVRPADALAMLLRSLGVPSEQIPVDVNEAATLYRTRLAGRRVLVLADNARSVDQVRSLLPGAPGCLVLVTSRDRLGGLVAREGAQRLSLDVLTADEAHDLLVTILGASRIDGEPDAAAELAEACAYLPLALRIAAANLVLRPRRSIADHVAELRDERGLARLAIDGDEDAAVQIAFDLSYESVPTQAQRLFRLLGLVPGPDVTPSAAAALADLDVDEAGGLLDRLASAHLLSEHSPDRYLLHDLLRRFAQQRFERDQGHGERASALGRLFTWYLNGVSAAAAVLYPHVSRLSEPAGTDTPWPHLTGPETALAWLNAELHNLAAAIHYSAAHGPRRFSWLLADGLRGFFGHRRNLTDWLATGRAALAAAEDEDDRPGQAAMRQSLAQMHYCLGHPRRALGYLTQALEINDEEVWAAGRASILGNLGLLYEELGCLDEAIDHHARALDLFRRAGRRQNEASMLNSLAQAYLDRGRLRDALETGERALRILREIGDAQGTEANVADTVGASHWQLGRPDDAIEMAALALRLHRKHANRFPETSSLVLLASIHTEAGRYQEAIAFASSAHAIGIDINEPRAKVTSLNALAAIHCRLGDHDQALAQFGLALTAAGAIELPYQQTLALLGLATTHRCLGDLDLALDRGVQAVDLARRHQFAVLEGRACTALVETHLHRGDRREALQCAVSALANHRKTGHRPGEARTLVLLGDLRRGRSTPGPGLVDDAKAARRHHPPAREHLAATTPFLLATAAPPLAEAAEPRIT